MAFPCAIESLMGNVAPPEFALALFRLPYGDISITVAVSDENGDSYLIDMVNRRYLFELLFPCLWVSQLINKLSVAIVVLLPFSVFHHPLPIENAYNGYRTSIKVGLESGATQCGVASETSTHDRQSAAVSDASLN